MHEIRRAKYACRNCEDGVTTAPGPDRVIEKGLLGPGFLAHVAVERFGQHMPDNRLEKKYASEGLSLSCSVLERSMKTLAKILQPIRARLLTESVSAPELFADDTPVTIANPDPARARGRAGSGSTSIAQVGTPTTSPTRARAIDHWPSRIPRTPELEWSVS